MTAFAECSLQADLSVSVVGANVLNVVGSTACGGGATCAQRRRTGKVVVVARMFPTADGRAERVTEVLGRPVVDDGVDARVGVGEPGAQHVDGLVPVALRRRSVEIDKQDEYVERQPEQREDDDDEYQQTTNLTLAVRRTGPLSPTHGTIRYDTVRYGTVD